MDDLPGFILAGFALAGSPGPNTLSLAAVGAAFGGRRGVGYLAGIIAGMVVVMLVSATGVTGVFLALPGAKPVVTALAALYFAYLAFRIATAPPLAENGEAGRRPTFIAGAFLSLVNPKAYAAMVALFSGFVLLRGNFAADVTLKVAILLAIILCVNLAWLFGGSALTRFFREPRTNRIINVTFAVLLVVSVAFALLF